MSIRPRISKQRKTLPTPTAASYRLTPVVTSATTRRSHQQTNHARIIFPNGIAFTQNSSIPRLPRQVGLRSDRPIDPTNFPRASEDNQIPPPSPTETGFINVPELTSPSKHRTKRLKQWERWTTEVLPSVVSPYLELQHRTQSLRDEAGVHVVEQACECCRTSRKLNIWVIRFSSAFIILIYSLL